MWSITDRVLTGPLSISRLDGRDLTLLFRLWAVSDPSLDLNLYDVPRLLLQSGPPPPSPLPLERLSKLDRLRCRVAIPVFDSMPLIVPVGSQARKLLSLTLLFHPVLSQTVVLIGHDLRATRGEHATRSPYSATYEFVSEVLMSVHVLLLLLLKLGVDHLLQSAMNVRKTTFGVETPFRLETAQCFFLLAPPFLLFCALRRNPVRRYVVGYWLLYHTSLVFR